MKNMFMVVCRAVAAIISIMINVIISKTQLQISLLDITTNIMQANAIANNKT